MTFWKGKQNVTVQITDLERSEKCQGQNNRLDAPSTASQLSVEVII